MPKEFFIEKPSQKEVKSKLEELEKYPDLKPRLTIAWPIAEGKEQLLEMVGAEEITEKKDIDKIMKLIESPDVVEKETGFYLLGKIKPSSEYADKIFPIIKEWVLEEKNFKLQKSAIESLGGFKEKGLALLEQLGKKNPYSEILSRGLFEDSVLRGLVRIGEKSLPVLEELSKGKDTLGEKEAIIEKINELKENNKKEAKKPHSAWLLSTKKSLFATPDIPELIQKMLSLEKISKDLQKKYKNKFTGFVVFGSTSKGYSFPKSDIDYLLIGSKSVNKKLRKDLETLGQDLTFCEGHDEYLSTKKFKKPEYIIGQLFSGLFFGNRKKLLEIQRNVLKKMNNKKWNKIRKNIMVHESSFDLWNVKAHRLDMQQDEKVEQVSANIALLRTPPPLKEARGIINKRYEQEVRKQNA